MQRTIAFAIGVTTLIGFAPTAIAQSKSPSPAQLLGVQERSIQRNTRTERPTVISQQDQDGGSNRNRQLVLYEIDRNTRVLVGPVRGATQSGEFSGNAQTGDNRLQLLRDLQD